jgi:hypothetical protein
MLQFFTRIANELKQARWLLAPHCEWLASISKAVPATATQQR